MKEAVQPWQLPLSETEMESRPGGQKINKSHEHRPSPCCLLLFGTVSGMSFLVRNEAEKLLLLTFLWATVEKFLIP